MRSTATTALRPPAKCRIHSPFISLVAFKNKKSADFAFSTEWPQSLMSHPILGLWCTEKAVLCLMCDQLSRAEALPQGLSARVPGCFCERDPSAGHCPGAARLARVGNMTDASWWQTGEGHSF